MKKSTKSILFYFSTLLFLVASYLIVIFALGYKYDFIKDRFIKTGSFEVRANIDAEIYINEELAGDTSFLGRAFSKGRLLPRTYSIRVQNDEYQPWEKLITVDAGFFTSFPKVVLLPKEFTEEFVASSSFKTVKTVEFDTSKRQAIVGDGKQIESISLENGQKTLITRKTDEGNQEEKINKSPDNIKVATFKGGEVWVEWLNNADSQPYKVAGDKVLVTRFSQKINDIQWYKDSAHLIIDVGGTLKLIEIDDRDGINIFDIVTVSGPFLYDKSTDSIFKFNGEELAKISLK
ncbi:MAG: hypothetical protein WD898_00525 [Candidatus Paceibacterota bacterium]